MTSPIDVVLARLDKPKRTGKGWAARCPAHEDKSPSLSITEADGGKVLLHCFSGCHAGDVLGAIGLEWKDLFPESLSPDARRDYQRKAATEAKREAELVIAMAQASAKLSPEDAAYLEQAKANAKQADEVLARIEEAPSKDGTLARHAYGGGEYLLRENGVYFTDDKDSKWLCSPLHILAQTRDAKSGEWGRLLEWADADGVRHRWSMPMELLQGDGSDVRRELARQGLTIAPGRAARELLASYLQVWPTQERARCVDRLGWHGGVYLTPTQAIGEAGELVVFQNPSAVEPALSQTGTAEQWRDNVAALAVGNSRLVFALSVAFAGPLAAIAGEDSGGFHLRGASSSGKSTALKLAASVWGNPESYRRLWRATANGLEGLAALHNDGVLILDELSQIEPREAGEAAYMLANGQGKARASRNGTARQPARWRVLFLSAGEVSLSTLIESTGKKANAGQEIRLADIAADAGAGMGAFENLHGLSRPQALSDALSAAVATYHGQAGQEWLTCLVEQRESLPAFISDSVKRFTAEVLPPQASGQAARVAKRFALVAVAGELASHFGITGWQEGEAIKAAASCFASWLDGFGGAGNREQRNMLAQVRAFFEAHGASRFEDVNAQQEQRVHNRAGFHRTTADGAREYLVLPEAFRREICKGCEPKAVARELSERGWLEPGTDGRDTQKPRLPGLGPTRCYVFTPRMWEDAP